MFFLFLRGCVHDPFGRRFLIDVILPAIEAEAVQCSLITMFQELPSSQRRSICRHPLRDTFRNLLPRKIQIADFINRDFCFIQFPFRIFFILLDEFQRYVS